MLNRRCELLFLSPAVNRLYLCRPVTGLGLILRIDSHRFTVGYVVSSLAGLAGRDGDVLVIGSYNLFSNGGRRTLSLTASLGDQKSG